MIAVALVVLQTVVAGLATAQAAAALAPGPFDGVICHGAGAGGAGPVGATAPSDTQAPAQNQPNACCAFCTAASPALLLLKPPVPMRADVARELGSTIPHDRAVAIAWRAVRAGSSQAPPSIA
jgi:hypothetical protein